MNPNTSKSSVPNGQMSATSGSNRESRRFYAPPSAVTNGAQPPSPYVNGYQSHQPPPPVFHQPPQTMFHQQPPPMFYPPPPVPQQQPPPVFHQPPPPMFQPPPPVFHEPPPTLLHQQSPPMFYPPPPVLQQQPPPVFHQPPPPMFQPPPPVFHQQPPQVLHEPPPPMFYPPVYNQAMSVDGYQWPNEVQYQPQVVPEAAYDPQAYSYNAPYEVTVAHNQESLPVMQSSFEKRVEGRLGSILKLLYTAKNHQTVKLEEVVGRLEAKIDQALNHFEQAVGNIEQRMEEFNTRLDIFQDQMIPVSVKISSESQQQSEAQVIQLDVQVESSSASAVGVEASASPETVMTAETLQTLQNFVQQPESQIPAVQNNTEVLSNTVTIAADNSQKPSSNSIWKTDDFPALMSSSVASETSENSKKVKTVVKAVPTSFKSSNINGKQMKSRGPKSVTVSETLQNVDDVTTVASDQNVNSNDALKLESIVSMSQKQRNTQSQKVMSRKNKRKNQKKQSIKNKTTSIAKTSVDMIVEVPTPDSVNDEADNALPTIPPADETVAIVEVSTPSAVDRNEDEADTTLLSIVPAAATVIIVQVPTPASVENDADGANNALPTVLTTAETVPTVGVSTPSAVDRNTDEAETASLSIVPAAEAVPIVEVPTPTEVERNAAGADNAFLSMAETVPEVEAEVEPALEVPLVSDIVERDQPSSAKLDAPQIKIADTVEALDNVDSTVVAPTLTKKQKQQLEREARKEEKARKRAKREAEQLIARQKKAAAAEELKKKREEEELMRKENAKPEKLKEKMNDVMKEIISSEMSISSAIFHHFHVSAWIEKQRKIRMTEAFKTVSLNMTKIQSILFYTDAKQKRFEKCLNPLEYFHRRAEFWSSQAGDENKMTAALFLSVSSCTDAIIKWDGFSMNEASIGVKPEEVCSNDKAYVTAIVKSAVFVV